VKINDKLKNVCLLHFSYCTEPNRKLTNNRIIVPRVTAHLENLEKSGNSKVVREKSGKMEKVRGK